MRASEKVRFGIIGIGMQGSGLLTNAIQLPGVECVAAADLYDGAHDIAAQASAAWEAAVCWDDQYAVNRLAEVRAV